MQSFLRTLILLPALLVFFSFTRTGDKINTSPETYSIVTYKDFIKDAYAFRVKNKMEIPEYYYDIIGIEDPTIPAFAKIPAKEEPKLRDSVPAWVRAGILATETRSYYKEDGTIKYVDKRRGKDIDIGPFQMRRVAFDEIKKSGESFWKLEKDTAYAEELACRYLLFIYNGPAKKDWERAIMMYNTGPYSKGSSTRGHRYLSAVKSNKI